MIYYVHDINLFNIRNIKINELEVQNIGYSSFVITGDVLNSTL